MTEAETMITTIMVEAITTIAMTAATTIAMTTETTIVETIAAIIAMAVKTVEVILEAVTIMEETTSGGDYSGDSSGDGGFEDGSGY